MVRTSPKTWTFRSKKAAHTRTTPLVAHWEVNYSPMSDDYTPDEASASELLAKWAKIVGPKYPNGLIPIAWFASSEESGTFEGMPFQSDDAYHAEPNFLTHYTWPECATTGERLNWFSLRVVDLAWNAKQANKGGFIQEATGWKPSILQPFVYLPALMQASGR